TYSLTVTDLKGCQKSDSVTVSEYSLIPNDDEINTYLFPNPATDNFSIQFETNENLGKLSFQLFNAIGQLMKIQETEEFSAKLSFDISNLPVGIYFLNIRNEERHLKTLKVVVE
ncbi:MAG: T9SS type A sorting domain-containing protein, partial [Chitinophagales bacterium]